MLNPRIPSDLSCESLPVTRQGAEQDTGTVTAMLGQTTGESAHVESIGMMAALGVRHATHISARAAGSLYVC